MLLLLSHNSHKKSIIFSVNLKIKNKFTKPSEKILQFFRKSGIMKEKSVNAMTEKEQKREPYEIYLITQYDQSSERLREKHENYMDSDDFQKSRKTTCIGD